MRLTSTDITTRVISAGTWQSESGLGLAVSPFNDADPFVPSLLARSVNGYMLRRSKMFWMSNATSNMLEYFP